MVIYENDTGEVYEQRYTHELEDSDFIIGHAIKLPFLRRQVFTKDVSTRARIRMTRELIKSGLFQNITVQQGDTGWLPVLFTLNYDGVEREGILMYPDLD